MATIADKLLTQEQLAEWMKVGVRIVRRLRTKEGLPFVRIGKFIRYSLNDVEEWRRKRVIQIYEERVEGKPAQDVAPTAKSA